MPATGACSSAVSSPDVAPVGLRARSALAAALATFRFADSAFSPSSTSRLITSDLNAFVMSSSSSLASDRPPQFPSHRLDNWVAQ